MKQILLVTLVILLLAGCAAAPAQETTEAPAPTETPASIEAPASTEAPAPTETTAPTEPPEVHYTLSFVGDCTLGTNPIHAWDGYGFTHVVGEDYGYPFRNVLSYFEEDEATFANLEGPLSEVGSPADKKHTFRGPERYVNILSENSVEFVSLANNHAQDYGPEAYESTRRVLTEAAIPFSERDSSTVFTTKNGLTIGVYAAVYYKIDRAAMEAAIRELSQQVDLVIFAPHWGVEGTYRPNEEQQTLAHAAIDAGARIVWGHHPHVLQKMEQYGEGIICYSLGNFSFGGNIYPLDFDTAIVRIEVIRDGEGSLRFGEISAVPCSISSMEKRNNYQPTPYAPDSPEWARVVSKLDGSFEGRNLPIVN